MKLSLLLHCICVSVQLWVVGHLLLQAQLSVTDVSARTTMKGAAKCDKHCELQNSENQQRFERILRFRDIPESMPASVSLDIHAAKHTPNLLVLLRVRVCVSKRFVPLTHSMHRQCPRQATGIALFVSSVVLLWVSCGSCFLPRTLLLCNSFKT